MGLLLTARRYFVKSTALWVAVSFLAASTGYAAVWNGIRLSPYASVSESYNDNIAYQKSDKLSDFITIFDAGLRASYSTHLSDFELAGILHYNLFASNSKFSNLSGDIWADWKQELSQYDRIHLRDAYVHSDEPISFVDAFNTRAGRYTFQTNEFTVNYEHDFTSQWTGTARY